MPITHLNFLVAEDHDFQRNTMVRMLSALGAKSVQAASDGLAALNIIKAPGSVVDIVLCDLDMPGMDGMEFIRHLGESRLPVAVILASALERSLVASVENMCAAYGATLLGIVPKPLTPALLLPVLERHKTPGSKPARAQQQLPAFSVDDIVNGLKDGEFEPFFQPKVELATRRVTGAEALARWRHPLHGMVPPYSFIPILEEHGMIDELMWVMLKKAAVFCSTWCAAGLDATVSVNLSLKSLGDVHLADRVTDIVRANHLEPRNMVLEVTESAATTNVGHALENLARLRMKGFGLSIDDYGTGFSSMQQLTRIAFTELKIDRCFVTDASKQESARVILGSSLDMARKLNIHAVAEGVETQQDWDLLKELGCSIAQGYFVARPMEAAAFLGWTRQWAAAG